MKNKLFLLSFCFYLFVPLMLVAQAQKGSDYKTVEQANVAVFLIDYPDTNDSIRALYPSVEEIRKELFDSTRIIQKYFKAMSYGKFKLTGDIFGPFTHQDPINAGNDYQLESYRTIKTITIPDFQYSKYTNFIFIQFNDYLGGGGCAFGKKFLTVPINNVEYIIPHFFRMILNIGYPGRNPSARFANNLIDIIVSGIFVPLDLDTDGDISFINNYTPRTVFQYVFLHELVHTQGVWTHANSKTNGNRYSFENEVPNNYDFSNLEYGNNMDIMGESLWGMSLGGGYRDLLGWTDNSNRIKLDTYTRQRVRLYPINRKDGYRICEIRIPYKYYTRNNSFDQIDFPIGGRKNMGYFLEVREVDKWDSTLVHPVINANASGILLMETDGWSTTLLDASPSPNLDYYWGSYPDFRDVALKPGMSYKDSSVYLSNVERHSDGSYSVDIEIIDPNVVTSPSILAPFANTSLSNTQTSFTANWYVSATATGYRLDVALDNAFTNYLTGYQNKDVGTATSLKLEGLNPNTNYYYRVRAYNPDLISENSNTINAITIDDPVANFIATPENGCVPLTVAFTDQSTGTPISWAWDIDYDGKTDYTTKNPTHTYTKEGYYRVKLMVIYSSGYYSIKISTNHIVADLLPASAGPISGISTVCQGQNSVNYTVQEIANASYYLWTLPAGASGTSSTNSITVNYGTSAVSGNISVKGHNYCSDSNASILPITVNPLPIDSPVANFTATPENGCVPLTVAFTDQSTGTPISWAWDIDDDGKTDYTTKNPTHTYTKEGYYRVKLTVTNSSGYYSTKISTNLIVADLLPASAGPISGISSVCQGQNSVNYTVPEIANASNYLWTLPTGTSGSSSTNSITVNYGTSAVSGNITVKGHNGCADGAASTLAVTVNAIPARPGAISGPSSVCLGQNAVSYTVPTNVNATSYLWELPTGATGTSVTNSILVSFGTDAVSGIMKVRGQNSCGDGPDRWLPITVKSFLTQGIPLNIGWNIISTNVIPSNLDLKTIFQPLIDSGSLKKVMDEAGKTIENFGAFGGWKNNIGNLNSIKGYKVNVAATSTLSLEGTPVSLPLDIALATGWNIISYPSATAQDAKALVQLLIDGGKLKKVMDEAGKTIENFGAFGGWKNNIGNFLSGKGYKVNVLENCTLTIPATANKAATIVPEVLASSHFSKVFTGNGTDHFNVHLVELASSGLKAEDQIGIFDGKYCVGAATIGSDQILTGNISIPASSNEEQAGMVNGFTAGHPVTLHLFRENLVYPLAPAKVGGTEAFEKNGSLFLRVTASDLPAAKINVGSDQMKYYPNPFVDQLTIEIRLTEPKKLEVNIYDLNGKLVRSLFQGDAGTSETLEWDGTNGIGAKMGSGTYILKANEMVEKVALKK